MHAHSEKFCSSSKINSGKTEPKSENAKADVEKVLRPPQELQAFKVLKRKIMSLSSSRRNFPPHSSLLLLKRIIEKIKFMKLSIEIVAIKNLFARQFLPFLFVFY